MSADFGIRVKDDQEAILSGVDWKLVAFEFKH